MTRILITGVNGQVGHELTRALAPLGEIIALDRAGLDLSDLARLPAVLDALKPDLIVNPAAYTAVDKAESEPALAHTVNAAAPGVLAEWAARHQALLLHYSTDYVFNGQGDTPWREDDAADPQSVYGLTKWQGEEAIRHSGCRHLILRVSWVFGAHGGNFLKTMLRLAAERKELKVVADQIGAPTSAALIADVSAQLLRRYLAAGDVCPLGTYHLAAAGATSWHGYAQYLIGEAEKLGFPLALTPDDVQGIPSAQYPLPAKRPANSRLDCNRLRQAFGLALPDWRQGVDETLRALKSNNKEST